MSVRNGLPSIVVDVMYDTLSVGAIVAFWLSLIVIVPDVVADLQVSHEVFIAAAVLSVIVYTGLRVGFAYRR